MEHFKWSVEVHYRVLRVSSFNGLYSAPRPFLLTLTTVNVDMHVSIVMYELQYVYSTAKSCIVHKHIYIYVAGIIIII